MTLDSNPDAYVIQERAAYVALLQSLGRATMREIEAAMAERDQVEPEEGLTPEVVQALKKRIKAHNAPAASF